MQGSACFVSIPTDPFTAFFHLPHNSLSLISDAVLSSALINPSSLSRSLCIFLPQHLYACIPGELPSILLKAPGPGRKDYSEIAIDFEQHQHICEPDLSLVVKRKLPEGHGCKLRGTWCKSCEVLSAFDCSNDGSKKTGREDVR